MPTPGQLRTIHQGARAVGLDDSRYRMLLRNVAGVESAKALDNGGVEDVMAVLEDSGFDSHPAGPRYWRNKVGRRWAKCGERMARKIEMLAAGSRYDLAVMCRRHSADRTDDVDQLTPREAWNLIEAYKAIEAREERRTTRASGQGGLFASKEDEPVQDAPNAATDGGTSTAWDDDVPF